MARFLTLFFGRRGGGWRLDPARKLWLNFEARKPSHTRFLRPLFSVNTCVPERKRGPTRFEGPDSKETPRALAFCAHTIMQRALLIIPDAARDERFAENPLVVSGPQYRFYAGAPLVTPDNRALGTLCVIDYVRRALTAAQKKDLLALSRLVMTELELRRSLRRQKQSKKRPPGRG